MSDTFPVQNDLKERDASLQLLVSSVLRLGE